MDGFGPNCLPAKNDTIATNMMTIKITKRRLCRGAEEFSITTFSATGKKTMPAAFAQYDC